MIQQIIFGSVSSKILDLSTKSFFLCMKKKGKLRNFNFERGW